MKLGKIDVIGCFLQPPPGPLMILDQRKEIDIRCPHFTIDGVFKRMVDILDQADHVDKYLCKEGDQDDPGNEVLKPGDEQQADHDEGQYLKEGIAGGNKTGTLDDSSS